ncbi:MAG: DNA-3-methyladenine glycosylase I [bacterium]|nr:DNA-3-methyladenine glycosylase I [bacterium]
MKNPDSQKPARKPAKKTAKKATKQSLTRCGWVNADNEMYAAYHDEDWGVPEYDDQALFEKLLLDGAQAGLSWLVILQKRETYRKAFDGFDPQKMARYTPRKVETLLKDPGIVRNRLKVNAFITNAQAYLKLREELGSFSDYLWDFVGGAPIQNRWKTLKQVPVKTPEAEAMSKDLKKRGFKFVGPTIVYAFMQAVGMVNDHTIDCHCYERVKKMGRRK